MRYWLSALLLVICFVLVSAAVSLAKAETSPNFPEDSEPGILVYSDYGDGEGFYWMRSDGSGLEQVLSFADPRLAEAGATWARLSPDGRKVLFLSYAPDSILFRLSLLDLETEAITQLTEDKPWIIDPNWSPDSSMIAYAAGGMGGEVYLIDVESGREWPVAAMYEFRWMGLSEYYGMSWSSASSKLALDYVIDQERSDYLGIFTVNADGSDLRFVTTRGESAGAPAWGDGDNSLYHACRGSQIRLTAICLMDVNRSLRVQLADMANLIPEQEILQTIAVSPAGQIAFTYSAYFGTNDQLYVFSPESGEVNTLRVPGAPYSEPQWWYRSRIPTDTPPPPNPPA